MIGASIQQVLSTPAVNRVVLLAAKYAVISFSTVDGVVAILALNAVIASATANGVISLASSKAVVATVFIAIGCVGVIVSPCISCPAF